MNNLQQITPLLTVRSLEKAFPARGGRKGDTLKAVEDISFEVRRGETFGLVGESGSGKSTAARCLLRLIEPTAGAIEFNGTDITRLDKASLRRLRRNMQMVFQDTTGTLDPRMSVRDLIEEPLIVHGIGTRDERRAKVDRLLELVGIRPELAERKPHQFSGGQRQRIGIARALVLDPDLVVLDEPISALDVSVQAQILNLLKDLQAEFDLAYVFIVHDLSIAEYFCDRIAVLYLGQVMEIADAEALFARPMHPYTVSLISAAPPAVGAARTVERIILEGEVSPISAHRNAGCPFRPRCPVGRDREVCATVRPALLPTGPGQSTACHFAGELALRSVAGR